MIFSFFSESIITFIKIIKGDWICLHKHPEQKTGLPNTMTNKIGIVSEQAQIKRFCFEERSKKSLKVA